jgi:hypothetical protein
VRAERQRGMSQIGSRVVLNRGGLPRWSSPTRVRMGADNTARVVPGRFSPEMRGYMVVQHAIVADRTGMAPPISPKRRLEWILSI